MGRWGRTVGTEAKEAYMMGRLKLSELAQWLRGYDYEVSGPEGDETEVVVTIDENGGIHLSAPSD